MRLNKRYLEEDRKLEERMKMLVTENKNKNTW